MQNIASPRIHGRQLVARLLRAARHYWPHLGAILALDLLAMPLALLAPLPLKIAVDNVLGGQPLPPMLAAVLPASASAAPLVLAVAAVIVLATLSQGQKYASWLLQAYTGEKIVLEFRSRLFGHVQRLSLAYHDQRGITDSIYRIQYDAPAIQWITVYGISPFLTAAVTVVAMIAVTGRLDWMLAAFALGVAPPLFMLTHVVNERLRRRWHDIKQLESAATSVVQEALAAVRVVKAFVMEQREQERFVELAGREVRANVALIRLQSLFFASVAMIIAGATAAALYVGVSHVQAGVLTLGELLVVMTYLAQLYGLLETLSNKLTELQKSFASAERAFALLDELPEVPEHPHARPIERAAGTIEFHDMSFAYDNREAVLSDVSLHIPAGSRVGVVGRTGAGKSTLASLLARFYDPQRGAILLDGIDLRDYRLADLRSQFAIVLQETTLFSATIAENIAYGRSEASRAEVEAAAEAAGAHEFIVDLPEGYDTQVGERGMLISGGQRQRIGLARAFLKDAPILILDEPTSAVDTRTEAVIMQAMERLMRGRTTIMIAHRVSTLERCDVVLEVEGGRISARAPADAAMLKPHGAIEGART